MPIDSQHIRASLPLAPLQLLDLPWLAQGGIECAVLRLDLIDPLISGNKWFKLLFHLERAERQGAAGLISLGGAYSNHLHALAAAGHKFGFETVGLLRGEPKPTATVSDLQRFGMRLHWLGYGGYRERNREGFWQVWHEQYPTLLPVPEGGGGLLGAQGCAAIVKQAEAQLAGLGWSDFDAWWLAAGTGTTMAGIALAERGRRLVYGAMAVPPGHGVAEQVGAIVQQGFEVVPASRKGFGKTDAALSAFMADQAQALPLEPLYTGKALMALHEQVAQGALRRGTRLVFVHTGGMQGARA